MKFNKPPLSIPDQVELLQDRGLNISDKMRAERYLLHIGYYRLSAYMLPFQETGKQHRFIKDVQFDDLLNLYIFDRKLRLLFLGAIERIEVSLRAQITDHLILRHGTHAYMEAGLFKSNYKHDWLIAKIRKACDNPSEEFIRHYIENYLEPELPPFWMIVHILTFVELSKLFENFKDKEIAQPIATSLGIKDEVLFSWTRSLSDLRNICAHHGRVWNRVFGTIPKIPRKSPKVLLHKYLEPFPYQAINGTPYTVTPQSRLFYQAVIVKHWLDAISPKNTWEKRFFDLVNEHQIDLCIMGFPTDNTHNFLNCMAS